MRWCLALATALFLLPASCATYSFVAQEGPDITLRLDPDGRVPTYNDGKLGLSIVPETSDGHLALRISVSNYSRSHMYLADTSFSARVSRDGVTWKPLRRYESQEFYDKEYKRYTALAILGGVNDALSNGRAGFVTSPSGEEYYDPVLAEEIRRRNRERAESYATTTESLLASLHSSLFWEVNLRPNSVYYGRVYFDFEPGTLLEIRVMAHVDGVPREEDVVFLFRIEEERE